MSRASPTPLSPSSSSDTTSHTLLLPQFSMHYDLHGDPNAPNKMLLIMGLLTDGAASVITNSCEESAALGCCRQSAHRALSFS
jgi:hypothetical protein